MRKYKDNLFERNFPPTTDEVLQKQMAIRDVSGLLFKKELTIEEKIQLIKAARAYCCAEWGLKEFEVPCAILSADDNLLKQFNKTDNSVWTEFDTNELEKISKSKNKDSNPIPERKAQVFFGKNFVQNADAAMLLFASIHEFRHALQYNLLYDDLVPSPTNTKRFKNTDEEYLSQLKSNLTSINVKNKADEGKNAPSLTFSQNKLYYLSKWKFELQNKFGGDIKESKDFDKWATKETEVDAEVSAMAHTESLMKQAAQNQEDGSFITTAKNQFQVQSHRFKLLKRLYRLPDSMVKKYRYRNEPAQTSTEISNIL